MDKFRQRRLPLATTVQCAESGLLAEFQLGRRGKYVIASCVAGWGWAGAAPATGRDCVLRVRDRVPVWLCGSGCWLLLQSVLYAGPAAAQLPPDPD